MSEEEAKQGKGDIERQLLDRLNYLLDENQLKNNRYFLLKANSNLKLKLRDIAEEKSIKAITQDQDQVAEALSKCSKAKLVEGLVSTGLKPKRNLLIVRGLAGKEIPEAEAFLTKIVGEKESHIKAESCGLVKVIFTSEENHEKDLKEVFEKVNESPFHGKKLAVIIEQEDLKGKLLAQLKIDRPYPV